MRAMKTYHPFLLLLVIASCFIDLISAQSNDEFLTIASAILQNKNTLSDEASSQSKFASWQGWNFNEHSSERLDAPQGMIIQNWKTSDNSYSILDSRNFNLRLFVGNYTDQKEFIVKIVSDSKNYIFNQSNATLIVKNVDVEIQDQDKKKDNYRYYAGDLYFYFVDKTTMKPPKTVDTQNLKAYTFQVRLETGRATNFISSFFDDSYPVSQQDKIILIIGLLIYTVASIGAARIKKSNDSKKISSASLLFLIFFAMYILFYLGAWFVKMSLVSELLYFIIPLALIVFANFIKHIIELSQNGDNNGCFLCIYPIILLIMVLNPHYGLYIGDLLSCICLLPQIIMKYQERYDRLKQLTWFEIGNWICILLWVAYLDLYPNNVFLASPKPILASIHLTVVFIQFFVLVYLQYAVPRRNPFQYTFNIQDSQDQEKLLSEQCAICIDDFEMMKSQEKLYKTPCGHFFHSKCLKSWGGQKLQCPVCRAAIPEFISPVIH